MTKKILILILSIIVLMSTMILVNAEDSVASIGISLDKTSYNPGDTVIVTIKITCEEGFADIRANYSYDSSILEYVSSGVTDSSNFSSYGSAQGSIQITYNGTEDLKTLEPFQIIFKVKEDITLGNKENVLELTNIIIGTVLDREITLNNTSVDITIGDESQQPSDDENEADPNSATPSDPNNTTNETGGNNETNNSNNNTSNRNNTNTNQSKNTATGRLPQTGTTNTIISIAVITIIAIAVGTYASYRRYKNM